MSFLAQVCDFGLSRFKANTFLSSKSVAGTVSFSFSDYVHKHDDKKIIMHVRIENYLSSNFRFEVKKRVQLMLLYMSAL